MQPFRTAAALKSTEEDREEGAIMRNAVWVPVLIWLACGGALPDLSPPPDSSPQGDAIQAFARFRAMAGDWEGRSTKGWTERVHMQVLARGSAVLETSFEAHPGEAMATLFALDGGALELRHYCVAGNQPHLRATEFAEGGRRVTFTFVDAGNLASRDQGHMDKATFLFEDENHVTTRWTWSQDSREQWLEEIRLTRQR